MNQGGEDPSLARLIERSAELKRALVDFAVSPRLERQLERFMREGAGMYEVLIEDEAIDVIDRFALEYRPPTGKSVLDQFLASWPGLDAADRELRADRAAFVDFFGGDELVLPPAEAEEQINAFYRHRQEAALAGRPARRRPPNIPVRRRWVAAAGTHSCLMSASAG
jgi:hypothetical protein